MLNKQDQSFVNDLYNQSYPVGTYKTTPSGVTVKYIQNPKDKSKADWVVQSRTNLPMGYKTAPGVAKSPLKTGLVKGLTQSEVRKFSK